MKKTEKSWLENELEVEKSERIKVTNIEEANLKSYNLKRAALIALTLIIIGLPVTHYIAKTTREKQIEEQIEQQIEQSVIERVKVNGITLEVATPDLRVGDNELTYAAPDGFIYDGYNCYRLICEGEAPAGYIKGSDDKTLYPVDSEIKHQAPDKYILVGDKAVEVVDAVEEEIDGKTIYTVPNGYQLVGRLGFKMINAIPLEDEYGNKINVNNTIDPIETTIYTAPSGDTLFMGNNE